MTIDTNSLRRRIDSLERALQEIESIDSSEDLLYDRYRVACLSGFELVLEQSSRLLRKRLATFFASDRHADRLGFRDLFRQAARHGLIGTDSVERWLQYRDNVNNTAHDYGEDFDETTLQLLPGFVEDAKALANMIEQTDYD